MRRQSSGRRMSSSSTVRSGRPIHRSSRQNIDQVQVLSPNDYLARSPDEYHTPAMTLTPPSAAERGEFQLSHVSQLTAPFSSAAFESEGSYTPMTATSDSSVTSASTALSEPMTRNNTNDVLCSGFDMFRMNSTMSNVSKADLESSNFSKVHDVDQIFPLSTMIPDGYHGFSSSSFSPEFSFSQQSFPSSSEMKHSPSVESNSSSHSVSNSSRMSKRMHEQNFHGKSRPLAPKVLRNDSSSSDELSMPKLVAVTSADGTVKHKAEIARTTRQQPPRKTTFCQFCNDQPSGFHGDHELRRHIERHHAQVRRVWICKDASEDGKFLSNCKACRNRKTYGANYNAAAHLRRAHFNPCKNKRGGRGKKSEGRGGMGGGNQPSMEFLKNWMYEEFELNVDGRVVVQNIMPDTTFAPVSMAEAIGYDPGVIAIDGFHQYDYGSLQQPIHEPHIFDDQMYVDPNLATTYANSTAIPAVYDGMSYFQMYNRPVQHI